MRRSRACRRNDRRDRDTCPSYPARQPRPQRVRASRRAPMPCRRHPGLRTAACRAWKRRRSEYPRPAVGRALRRPDAVRIPSQKSSACGDRPQPPAARSHPWPRGFPCRDRGAAEALAGVTGQSALPGAVRRESLPSIRPFRSDRPGGRQQASGWHAARSDARPADASDRLRRGQSNRGS